MRLPLFLSCCLPLTVVLAESIDLHTPLSGWREGRGEGANFTQTVNYPASSVNTPEQQAQTARIQGQIHATTKATNPARLVVNGVSMPLRVEEDGQFDRPFVFPAGSNSVEVRGVDGAKRRVQFYSQGANQQTPAKLRVVLSWDSDNTDLDLHVVTPDGQRAWYGGRVLQNGGALDVDVTTGFGPEIFATPTPLQGPYLIYVNYYGGGYSADQELPEQALTTAQITLITQEGTPSEKQESFIVPMRTPGELTLVKRFSYP